MADHFHYPHDVFDLLIETIPRLVKYKKDVFLFFEGAGVDEADLRDARATLAKAPQSISKFDIARDVLTRLNRRQDSGLAARREVIKRVTQFESFETCWDNERLKAKGLVASVREAVNAKDTFTRMKNERDSEREQVQARHRDEQLQATRKRNEIDDIKTRLFGLFSQGYNPQERGKLLENVLNDLFRAYGIQVRENFVRKPLDGATVLEQIDGVIELAGKIHLVEMKWLKDPVGVADFGPHLVRVMGRADALHPSTPNSPTRASVLGGLYSSPSTDSPITQAGLASGESMCEGSGHYFSLSDRCRWGLKKPLKRPLRAATLQPGAVAGT